MQCPHCLKNIHVEKRTHFNFSQRFAGVAPMNYAGNDGQRHWWLEKIVCPSCQEFILIIVSSNEAIEMRHPNGGTSQFPDEETEQKIPVWPRSTGRSPVPPEVPGEFSKDYEEACLILADSPNASAALSRRCLQFILREKLGAPNDTLYKEIQWAINSAGLPSSLTDILDVVRRIGNKAAHPMFSANTGVIVDVEPWEAEWCLEVIEALYDHIFVVPARSDERMKRLGLS